MKIPVMFLGAVVLVLLYMMALAAGNTSEWSDYYWWFFGANSVILTALIITVTIQILRLRKRVKTRVFGAKLTQRLVLVFALVALVPGMLVFTVSAQFLTRSIESWFNVRVESALDLGLDLGRNALGYVGSDLIRKSQIAANQLVDVPKANLGVELEDFKAQMGLKEVAIFTQKAQTVALAGPDSLSYRPRSPSIESLKSLPYRQAQQTFFAEEDGIVLSVMLSYYSIADDQTYIIRLLQPAPETIARDAELIEAARSEYNQLLLGRDSLRTFYMLTLVMVFAMALFGAFAFALYIADRMSAPLSELAAGTRAVAQGDFTKRQAVYRHDELGVLATLFNRMTDQLEEARRSAEDSRIQLEASKLYLESILANLSAGVIAFDGNWRLRAANLSASKILGVDFDVLASYPVHEWPMHDEFLSDWVGVLLHEARLDIDWQKQVEYQRTQGSRVLLMRGAHLPDRQDVGYVLVFDDITELAVAQRDAAWGEVAKRLAHEIRNPLTPIQLSAERLAMKLMSKLEGNDADMLRRSTDTIIKQVGALKGMVDAFRDYARAPGTKLETLNLNILAEDVLTLYETQVGLCVDFTTDELPILGDASLLRQLLHNLLRNAQDATCELEHPLIRIVTRLQDKQATISVEDNGAGFSPEVIHKVFEPYVTTKAKGTGLGLAIVKKIIDEHQGQISVSNNSQGGAKIVITLPLLEV